MKYSSATDESGFTLIEVIVAIVLVGSLSGIMIAFLSDSLVKSSQSIGRLRKVSDLNKVMANITQYYNGYPKWRSGTAYAPGNFVVPTKRNGKFYACNPCGTSGNNEPDWSLPPITDGVVVTWIEGVPPPANPPDRSTLQVSIGTENSDQNNAYGKYHVERNRCVFFPSDSEQDDTGCGNNILKVTIRSDQGEALTALFLF